MKTLSVDPGTRALGWAEFNETQLIDCGIICAPNLENMLEYLTTEGSKLPAMTDTLVIERPHVYSGPRQKGDPNDILAVAIVLGAVVGSTEYSKLRLIFPRDWKGTVDKMVMGQRILSTLSPEEMRLFEQRAPRARSTAHNVSDAIGLGLKQMGRL